MRLCEFCRAYYETKVHGMVPICRSCFLKVDGRLFEERKADAKKAIQWEYQIEKLKREYEIEKLKYWWRMSEDNCVGR